MPEIHKGKRRRKTRIWLADLYFLYVLACCRSWRLVLAAGDDLFHQFHVLNTLLGSIHGFLHQPLALIAEHVILVHKFL